MKYKYYKTIFTEKVMLRPYTYEYNIKMINKELVRISFIYDLGIKLLKGCYKYQKIVKS
jgi:hypothetical protein